MRSKLLIAILGLGIMMSLSGVPGYEEKYLPTWIHVGPSTMFDNEILLHFKAAFHERNIKTISRDEAMEMQKSELESVLKPYFEDLKRSGRKMSQDEINLYTSTHTRKVCNSLSLTINIKEDGVIKDSVRWSARTLPFDMLDMKRPVYSMVLKPAQKTSVITIVQAITDSIIASNALAKE